MTEKGGNFLIVLNSALNLIGFGGQKTLEDKKRTWLLAEQYESEGFNVRHVFYVEKSKVLPTTKITINR